MKPLKFLLYLFLLNSCAQIVIPDGGEKDVTPPVLIKSSPESKSLNIYPSKISLYFNENVDLKNQSEVYITPDINSKPTLRAKKNRIDIELPKDSLLPNTTYSINFGKSIVDINEGNILEKFTYTFSTGKTLDTTIVSGTVVFIKTNKPVEKASITLQNSKNSLKYTTSTNKTGSWVINSIARGNYTFTAFKDNNTNKRLDAGEYYFKGDIVITDSPSLYKNKLITYSLTNDSGKLRVDKASYLNNNSVAVKFSKNVPNINKVTYSLNKQLNKKEDSLSPTEKVDSFILYHPFIEKDSMLLIIETDTLQKILITQPKKRTKEENTLTPALPVVRKTDPIYIYSNIPISLINSDKIKVNGTNSGFEIRKVNPYKLSLSHTLQSNKEIIFEVGAIKDINGKENKLDTMSVLIASDEETGSYEFIIKDTISDYKGSVYVKISNQTNEYILKTELNKPNKLHGLLPGNYTIEAWEDENNNEKWDEGNYLESRNPEKIILLKDYVMIKPNWDTTGVEIYLD